MWKFLNEATIDSVLLAAIEQFEDRATNRLLIAALEDSGTTQKEDVFALKIIFMPFNKISSART